MNTILKTLIVLLFLLSVHLNATQKQTDNISHISAFSLYNIDEKSLQSIINEYSTNHSNLKALVIIESLSNKVYISMYRDHNGKFIQGKLPSLYNKYIQYKSISKFEGEKVGEVLAYYENKELIKLTSLEKKWLSENTITLSVDDTYAPMNFKNSENKMDGLSIDYIKLIEKKIGYPIKLDSDKWPIALENAMQHKTDGIINANSNERRAKKLLFTNPYITVPMVMITSESQKKYNNLNELKNKTILVKEKTIEASILPKKYPSLNVKEVKNYRDAFMFVSTGKADGVFGHMAVLEYEMNKYLMPNIKKNFISFSDLVTNQSIAIRNTAPILKNILDKAILSISTKQKQIINDKWMKPITEDNTSLSIKEIKWLKENPPIKIAVVDNYPPYDFRDNNGKLDGFHSDLTSIINKNLGLNIKLKPFKSWSEAYSSVLNSSTDGIYSLSWSEERNRKYFNYSSPYHFSPYHLVVQSNNMNSVSLENLSNKIIAVEKNTIFKNIVKEKAPQSNILFVKNIQEAYDSVKNGEAFATISPNINDVLFKESGLKVASEVYHKSSNLYIGTNKNNPIISSIISKGVNSISLQEINSLRQKWFTKTKATIELNDEEQKWIKMNPDVKIIEFFDEPPFTLNGNEKKGYVYELVEYLVKSAGLNLKYIDGYNSYGSMINALEKAEVDILTTFPTTLDLGKDSNVVASKSVLKTPFVIIGKFNSKVQSIEDLYGKKIAVVKGYAQDKYLDSFPEIKKVHVSNNDEGFNAIRKGDAQFYINNRANTEYILHKSFSTDLDIIYELPYREFPPLSISFAMNGQKDTLVKILNKALEQIPYKKLKEIREKWLVIDNQKKQKVHFTNEEKVWLEKHQEIKIAVMNNWEPLNYVDKEGNPKGLGVDFINLINEKLDGVLKIYPDNFSNNLENVKSKKIDALLDVTPTLKREEFYNFTKPYITIPHVIIAKKDSSINYKDLSMFANKKVAVEKGYGTVNFLEKNIPTANLVYYENSTDALDSVSRGETDVYVGNRAVSQYIIERDLIGNLKFHAKTNERESILAIGVRKDWKILRDILDKVLDSITVDERKKIIQKYIHTLNENTMDTIKLTETEKNWIKNNIVKIGIEEWAPVVFSHGGKDFDGITGDVLRLIIERTGLQFEVVNDLWDPLLSQFKNKELDLLPATYYTDERATYGLYTDGYYKMLDYIYIQEDNTNINSMEDLIGKRIAIPRGFGTIPKIKEKYPDITIVETRDLSDSIQRVLHGEVDALYDGQIAVSYKMQEELIIGLKGIPQKAFEAAPIHFFSHIDKPILKNILNKALQDIQVHEINQIKSKWLVEKRNEKMLENIDLKKNSEDTWWLIITVVSVFLFLLFILLIVTKFISNDFIAKSFGSSKFRFIILVILSAVIFMLSVLVVLTLNKNKKETLFSTKSDLEYVLKNTQNRLDTWMTERKNFLLQIGRDRELVDATKALLKLQNDAVTLKSSRELEHVRNFFAKRNKEFGNLGFFIIDKNFISIASKRDNNIGTKNLIAKHNPKLLERVLKGETVFIPPMLTDVAIKSKKENTNEHTMFFAIPIQDKDGNVIAIMTQRLDVEGKFSEIVQSGRIGQSGESYIFSNDGYMLTQSRFRDQLIKIGLLKENEKEYESIQIKDPGGNLVEGYKSITPIEKQPLTKMASSAISLDKDMTVRSRYSKVYVDIEGYRDYRGVNVFGSWIWYKEYGFGLTTEVDEDEALLQFYVLRQNLLIIAGLTLLLTVLSTIMLIILGEKSTRSVQKANDDLNKLLTSFDENVIASKTNTKGIIVYASKAFCEVSGYSQEELIGSPQNIVRHPDTPKSIFKDLWKTIQSGKRWNGVVKNRKKDGSFYWVEVVINPEFDENNKITGYSAIRQNITAQKDVEVKTEILNTQKKELEKVLTIFDDNIISSKSDLQGNITAASKAFSKITEYSIEELIGKPHSTVRHPDMPHELFKDLWQTIQSGKVWKGEVKNLTKSGGYYWVDAVITPEFDENHNIIGYSAIRQDITSKKEVEELSASLEIKVEERTKELDENVTFMNTLIQNLPTAVFAKDVNNDFRFITWNKHSEELFGMKSEDMLGKNDFDFFPKEEAEVFLKTDQEVVKKNEVTEIPEETVTTAKGEKILNTLKIGIPDENGKPNILLGIAIDITEQKKAQQTILDQQQQFSSMAANVPGVIYRCKVDAGWTMLYISEEIKKLSGYDVDGFINNKTRTFADIMHKDDIEPVAVLIQNQIEKGEKFLVDYRVIDNAGTIKWVRSQGQVYSNDEGEQYLDGVLFDVTEQRALEQEIKENQEQMTYVSQFANLGFWNFNPQIGDLYVNDIFVQMLGYNADEVLVNGYDHEMFKPFKDGLEFWKQLLHPDDIERTSKILTAHINGETDLYKVEYRMRRADGSWMWSLAVGKIAEYDESGKPIRFNGVNLDIQESKEAQKTIEDQKKYTESIMNSQSNIVISTDGLVIRTANKSFLEFFNVESKDEFLDEFGDCICDTFDIDNTGTFVQKSMGGENWIDYVYNRPNILHKTTITRDGFTYTFGITSDKFEFQGEELMVAVFTDITEIEAVRKNIEMILSNIMLPVLITSKHERKILYANEYASKQYEAPIHELIGSNIDNVYTSIEQKNEILEIMDKDGYVENLEERYKTQCGKEFIGLLSVKPILYNTEEAYIGMVVDITNQKDIEQELRRVHKHTKDSIEYAALIQSALIPSSNVFNKYFNDFFTIWQPKDIVGGDIYLFEELRDENECLLMVIDCTGHGVPGAFVTMLVKAIERQVVAKIENDKNIEVSPAWILSYFNKTMKKLLKQESDESISNAGFDGGVLYYNRKENYIKYAGAETPLFYMQNNELQMIKGNRHSIGYKKSDVSYEFQDYKIDIDTTTKVYMTTDGYLDQNGGEKGFPFGKSKFKELISQNNSLLFEEQKEILLSRLTDYMKDEERNDDTTVVGIEILVNKPMSSNHNI